MERSKVKSPNEQQSPSGIDPVHCATPDIAFQRRLLASLDGNGRSGSKSSVEAMLCNASMLFAETIRADQYAALLIPSNQEYYEFRFGSPQSNKSDEIIKHRIAALDVPTEIQRVLIRNESVVFPDWQETIRDSSMSSHKNGLSSVAFCPVRDDTGILGMLGVGSFGKRVYDPAEILFGESLAQVVSTSYTNQTVRLALKKSDTNQKMLLDTLDALVCRLARDGTIKTINRACCEKTESGIDITQQAEAIDSLQRVQKEVVQAKRALADLQQEFASMRMNSGTGEQTILTPQANYPKIDERRASVRRSYPYSQLIAPIIGGRLPDRAAFHEVTCRDIGGQGLSFFVKKPPRYRQYVIALGSPAAFTFLASDVVHVTPVEQNGHLLYIVGCHYTSKVEI